MTTAELLTHALKTMPAGRFHPRGSRREKAAQRALRRYAQAQIEHLMTPMPAFRDWLKGVASGSTTA